MTKTGRAVMLNLIQHPMKEGFRSESGMTKTGRAVMLNLIQHLLPMGFPGDAKADSPPFGFSTTVPGEFEADSPPFR